MPDRRVILASSERELEAEKAAGKQAAEQVEQQLGLVDAPELVSYVQSVGRRVAEQSPRGEVEYAFQVVDTADVNAFALPGGYIYVTRGLLALTNSEDELANVLAHEVGHVTGRHHIRQQSRAQSAGLLSTVGTLAAVALGGAEAAQLLAGLSQSVAAGYLASHGREQEREADAIGQLLASRAGWDPAGMPAFLETLDRDTQIQRGSRPKVSFLDTHPTTPERVVMTAARARQLRDAAPARSGLPRPEYLDRLVGLAVGEDPAQGIFEDQTFLHRGFDLHLSFPGGWSVRNTPSSVGALSKNEAALLKLELQGRGDDVRAAAAQFLESARGRVVRRNGLRLGGLPAYRAVLVAGESAVELNWITHHGLIFRLTGVTAADKYPNAYERLFRETAESLRPLMPEEVERIQRLTLRTVRARAGETLAQLTERTDNRWSIEQTAAANRLFPYDPLEDGQLIKIAAAERYEPSPAREAGGSAQE